MIIDNAAIKMHGNHRLHHHSQRTESIEPKKLQRFERSRRSANDHAEISDAGKSAKTEKRHADMDKQINPEHSLSMEIIRRMVKEITGEDLQLFSPSDLQDQADAIEYHEPQPPSSQNQGGDSALVYQQSLAYFEAEITTFSAEGSIKTKDGQTIDFSVSLSMSRMFYAETNLSLAAGQGKKTDPLVINFEGTAAELSTTSFQFDIDANGSPDQIATLKSNSGMLALDKNQDGNINDGSELFGAKTGDGFSELAAYDEDGNRFIDAGDSIYNKLRIWQRHGDGSQRLFALGEKNIGAIFLGHLSTPFELKAADNNRSLGDVASSGLYLTEQGRIGSVQQINFTV